MKADRPGAALLVLIAGTAVLAMTGGGRLAMPLGSTTELTAWVRDTPPAFMAGALLRQLALLMWGYLLVAVLVRAGAQVLGWRSLAALATRALPVALRQLTGTAGLGITATSVLCAAQPVGASEHPPAAPVPDAQQRGTSVASMTLLEPPPAPGTATMWLLDDAAAPRQQEPATARTGDAAPGRPRTTPATTEPSDPTVAPTTPAVGTTPAGATMTPTPMPGTPTGPPTSSRPGHPAVAPGTVEGDGAQTWVIEAGDSFWSIAEDVIAEEIGPGYRDEDVDAYWQVLVAANRDRLAVPDQPDLLFTGQVLTLPRP